MTESEIFHLFFLYHSQPCSDIISFSDSVLMIGRYTPFFLLFHHSPLAAALLPIFVYS